MILIIDDDKAVQVSLQLLLKQQGLETRTASSPAAALEAIEKQVPRLILMDMNYTVETTGEEGLALLKKIKSVVPTVPVILITGWATIELAIEGMKAGAKDFISKPWTNEALLQSIKTTLAIEEKEEVSLSRKKLDEVYDFSHIIGEDPKLLEVLSTVGRVASTDASILILGESGTGKELIAEAIHQNSARQQGTFVKVNLGGISSSLFESEMFGHKRGAFTDARYDRKGRFEMAHRGSIFLDEIGELALASQVKLLRVLQDRTFEILGSSRTQNVDIRVISATNRNLAEMVKNGQFREDLFYRINLITVYLPALRERPGDIPLLVNHYVNNLKMIYNRPEISLTQEALNWLKNFDFPGNIRQLKNLVERTVLISPNEKLKAEDFIKNLSPMSSTSPDTADLPQVGSITLDEMEKEMILKAMAHHNNRITKVAKSLGLTRSALYRRLEKYAIPYNE